jgi:hypothetical protein
MKKTLIFSDKNGDSVSCEVTGQRKLFNKIDELCFKNKSIDTVYLFYSEYNDLLFIHSSYFTIIEFIKNQGLLKDCDKFTLMEFESYKFAYQIATIIMN